MELSEQTQSSRILGYLTYVVLAVGGIFTIACLYLSFTAEHGAALPMFLAAVITAGYTAIAWAGIKIFIELCDNVQVIRDYIVAISNNEKIEIPEEEDEEDDEE